MLWSKMIGRQVREVIITKEQVDCGLGAAVLRSAARTRKFLSSASCPVMSSTVLTSPWRMNRAELLIALDALQVPIHPKWTVPELRQTLIEHRQQVMGEQEDSKMKGLGKMSLAELKAKCEENQVSLPVKATRGLMIKLLREAVQPSGEQVMVFGKYKYWMFKEVPMDYAKWAVAEVAANPNSSEDLQHFAREI